MIPGKILRFLEQRANSGLAGARDGNLVPCGFRVSAWRVAADGRTLTAFIPDPFADRLIELLQDNGQFAMTVEEHPTHETYQFKGRYLRHRPSGPEDLALVAAFRERFTKSLRGVYPDDVATLIAAAVPDPKVSVDIDVHEVYVQTPGPGAGGRLYPPPDVLDPNPQPAARSPKPAARSLTPDMPPPHLPDEIRSVLDNGLPALMVTCSADGIPNATVISQVYYVDATHAALSFQFFSKTIKNVRENPRAWVGLEDFIEGADWVLDLEFQRSETAGPIFDAMDMQIEAIASATGMSGIFKLRGADIYRVLSVEKIPHAWRSTS